MLFSYGLLHAVTKPTRRTSNSATLIDHVITNSSQPHHTSLILTSRISDHFPVCYFLNSSKASSKPSSVTKRDFSDINLANFKTAIDAVDWRVITGIKDVQSAYTKFSDIFYNHFNNFFPLKSTKFIKN